MGAGGPVVVIGAGLSGLSAAIRRRAVADADRTSFTSGRGMVFPGQKVGHGASTRRESSGATGDHRGRDANTCAAPRACGAVARGHGPGGVAVAAAFPRVPRRRLHTEVESEIDRLPQRGGDRVQGPRQGVGPLYQRRYTVRIACSPLTAAELIDRVAADLNAASPVEVAVFDKTSGASRPLAIGDEYVVHMPGPWNCPVRVVERAPASFRLVTLSGHLEAGEIEFRVDEAREDGLVFIIESWARSGDRLAEILYEGVGIAKEMQLHMWTHFCTRVAELSGGTMIGDVEVQTERVDVADAYQGQQLVEHAVTAAFARTFALAARLRDRPLHPKGLVFDAALVLHGTSQHWGVPFLDERTELRGEVRLSRAIGLPPPLPDLLGLALRWRQPSTGDAGAEATAELLLATTGHTTLGRHLLRPATHWSPTFYGSLLACRRPPHPAGRGRTAAPDRPGRSRSARTLRGRAAATPRPRGGDRIRPMGAIR